MPKMVVNKGHKVRDKFSGAECLEGDEVELTDKDARYLVRMGRVSEPRQRGERTAEVRAPTPAPAPVAVPAPSVPTHTDEEKATEPETEPGPRSRRYARRDLRAED